ncbi:MAG: endonuclease/exonuclease/phosphatase family protein [Spirochaetia bacterium]|nr:endonuclease/exonuclease/phosphatase family protein [Spirochaetia bacterium]
MKKRNLFWIVPVCLAALTAVAVGCYAAYAFIAYERLPEEMELEIKVPSAVLRSSRLLRQNEIYTAVSYNIGFGAYTPEFSFFMDGGTESVAASAESVKATVGGAAGCARGLDPDFVLFQEVDLKATRSYYINESELIDAVFPEYYHTFAVNYDSPFLFYPILQPHGRTKAGLATYSRYPIVSAVRYALPISEYFDKFFDLDRCYAVMKIPVENGKFLDLYHVHLSAYSEDAKIREGQTLKLMGALKRSYKEGNYVICAGDFNHDMKNPTQTTEQVFSWAHIFPRETLPEGFFIVQDRLPEAERFGMPDSSRNSDMPYDPEKTMTITLDAFIVSDNVETVRYSVIDHGFLFSDHQPVVFSFRLK